MKNFFGLMAFLIVSAIFMEGCSRGISPFEAANGKAKCRRHIN
jgi:hypothetical protein